MKTLIFSDSHLTARFEPKKYELLKRIVSNADQVIVNGDFWDGFSTTFNRFVNSDWQKLFPLLISKNTIYIYGNHDRKSMTDKRVNLFSVKQMENYKINANPRIYIIEHGHKVVESLEKLFPTRALLVFANRVHSVFEYLAYRLFGKFIFQHSLYKKFSDRAEKYVVKHLNENEVLVCGHTHRARYLPENKYLNSGFIRHGLAQYLVLEGSKIEFREERY
jgi:predicted phosphodiesterase